MNQALEACRDGWRRILSLLLGGAIIVVLAAGVARAADWEEAREQYATGRYAECLKECEAALEERTRDEDWPELLLRAHLAVGNYPEALERAEELLNRFPFSVRLRVLAHRVFLLNGEPVRARRTLEEINRLGGSNRWRYQDPASEVALGRAALLLEADPRVVLDNFFMPARQSESPPREAFQAAGELALAKHDYAMAARTFEAGLREFPEDADLYGGLAAAYAPSDRRQMMMTIESALSYNTNHVPSLLLLAEHLIDGEEYDGAARTLGRILAVNPRDADAWAFHAVLAHLDNDPKGESRSRDRALGLWTDNPRVDHLIGRKLSQKYRFAEGAEYQRRALEHDPRHVPAKIQLAQDLLRLGEDEQGWELAREVHAEDAYDVTAYNLVTLRDTLDRYSTLTNEHFTVRMASEEARIYGPRVMDLLSRAREGLSGKYGVTLPRRTLVEIFADQGDFAVRTFGMPGNPGYLGVCFGSVITANSPAAQSGPVNWEAVLWHEFCHTITLTMTRNRMPRWLSEGISVYEEKLENPTWGQDMTPRYRSMILEGELTPISELSAAFLAPRSNQHLQFAYYQSSLVVEYLVDRFGVEAIRAILRDLGEGEPINDSIERHTTALEELEVDFEEFARKRAEGLAPGLDWDTPDDSVLDKDLWAALHPRSFQVLTERARELIGERKYEEAKEPLNLLLEEYPGYTGGNNAYSMLALAHRELGETDAERAVLSRLAARSADATDAYLRLMELGEGAGDWRAVEENANRYLAVNPLVPPPHAYLGRASEALDQPERAAQAYRVLLMLDPPDPAEAHFRLARVLHRTGDPAAKRQVLMALEEAPRFRDAHRLLLELHEEDDADQGVPEPEAIFGPTLPRSEPPRAEP